MAGVISVGLDLEFDNDFYDNAPEDAYTLGVRTTLSAHGTGAGSAALEVLDGVNEPFLRAALAGIAMAGADEGWFQQTAIDIGLTDEMLACVDSEASDPAAACDPANADVIERAFFHRAGRFQPVLWPRRHL